MMARATLADSRRSERHAGAARKPLNRRRAAELMRLFKVFASETRLRLLDALVCNGELCVSELCEAVGMKPQAVSNQLQRLLERGMVAARRDGNNVYYRVVDPCVQALIEHGLCLIGCLPGPPASVGRAARHAGQRAETTRRGRRQP